jgi:hypothetical protein
VIHAKKFPGLGTRVPKARSQEFDDRVARKHDGLRSRGAECGPKKNPVFFRDVPNLIEYFQFLKIMRDGVDVSFGSSGSFRILQGTPGRERRELRAGVEWSLNHERKSVANFCDYLFFAASYSATSSRIASMSVT